MRKQWLAGLIGILILVLAACESGLTPAPVDTPLGEDVETLACTRSWPTVQSSSAYNSNAKVVQYLLKSRGYNLTVDGYFGSGTLSTVKSFQSSKGLTSDGIVGKNTWEKLVVTVQQGSQGDAVRAVQFKRGITVDGIFGSGTKSSVINLQSSKGLPADGIVNTDTWAALVGSVSCSSAPPAGTTRAQLAQQIINSGRVVFATSHSSGCGVGDGASARNNIDGTKAGATAKRSSYDCSSALPAAPGGSVYLNTSLLNGMLALSKSYSFSVSEIAGGQHSGTSRHYSGVAVDVYSINGSPVNSSNTHYRNFMQACRNLGATEVLGPGDSGHSTHVHCAWPRP